MIGLVSCSSLKLEHAAPARELYVSPLFRMSLAYARARCSSVYVLSALHGLVELDAVIEPYDRRLDDSDVAERQIWGSTVVAELEARHGESDLMVLAGQLYAGPVRFYSGHWGRRFLEPLRGMMLGRRLQWLTRETRR